MSMSSEDRAILRDFSLAVRGRFPEALIWAYGSRARGTAREDSDLDVCVVVENLDTETDRAIMRTAWEVGFERDVLISTVTYSREEFEHGPCAISPLVRTVVEEGIVA